MSGQPLLSRVWSCSSVDVGQRHLMMVSQNGVALQQEMENEMKARYDNTSEFPFPSFAIYFQELETLQQSLGELEGKSPKEIHQACCTIGFSNTLDQTTAWHKLDQVVEIILVSLLIPYIPIKIVQVFAPRSIGLATGNSCSLSSGQHRTASCRHPIVLRTVHAGVETSP